MDLVNTIWRNLNLFDENLLGFQRTDPLNQRKGAVIPEELNQLVITGISGVEAFRPNVDRGPVEMALGVNAGATVRVAKVDDVGAVVARCGSPDLEVFDDKVIRIYAEAGPEDDLGHSRGGFVFRECHDEMGRSHEGDDGAQHRCD